MKAYRFHLIAGLLVVLDQCTKLAARGFSLFGITHEGLSPGEVIPVLGNVVRFTLVENAGSAFGLDWGEGKIILSVATMLIAGGLFWYLRSIESTTGWLRIAVMLLLAGAVGNVIDRTFYGVAYGYAPLFLGSVVDFIQVDIPDMDVFGQYWTHFPVFNVADSCVTIGIVLMLLTGGKTSATPSPESAQSLDSALGDGQGASETSTQEQNSMPTLTHPAHDDSGSAQHQDGNDDVND
ncbi:MAG: signal peptidase II [Bradyrhizobiaceae bacterium]|nr:signal peptidase II [Bradyrhizobiaceae bacterium]